MLKVKQNLKIVILIFIGIVSLFLFPIIIEIIYNIGVYIGTVARMVGDCMK